jgi:hypothetical protein
MAKLAAAGELIGGINATRAMRTKRSIEQARRLAPVAAMENGAKIEQQSDPQGAEQRWPRLGDDVKDIDCEAGAHFFELF